MQREVFFTQKVFKSLLRAMSFPGTVQSLEFSEELYQFLGDEFWALGSIALTLIDGHTSFCVIGPNSKVLEERIIKLTRSKVLPMKEADFVITTEALQERLWDVKVGELRNPEKSATVIYLVEGVQEGIGGGVVLRLSGPGVKGERLISLFGLPPQEFLTLSQVNHLFPLGIDCFFVDKKGMLVGIPRSVKVEVL
jgi:phosphonate C-P lyase system protein PhnH